MKTITKVYGIRNCLSCKGIIHEKAFRTKTGQRKRYFCRRRCVERYVEKRIKKYLPRGVKLSEKTLNKATNDYIDDSLEQVFVITK